MLSSLSRIDANPILRPDPAREWESFAAFNGNVIEYEGRYHLLYRALSAPRRIRGHELRVSSVGHAISEDGIHFESRRLLIRPEAMWDQFGCEDPRAAVVDGKLLVFYTAIGTYPFSPAGIRVGLAILENWEEVSERHLVTPFNAKAMALFPEKVGGRHAAILAADTDRPPASIGIATFDQFADLWSPRFWETWYKHRGRHTLPLQRLPSDQVEVGAPPVRLEEGWLLVYSRIQNYGMRNVQFGVEAALLDRDDPTKILGRTVEPLMVPRERYEVYGTVPNVVFPSGVTVSGSELRVYYGAGDTVCAVASCSLKALLGSLR